MRSHLLIVVSVCAISVLLRKLPPVLICSKLATIFSSIKFSVSVFLLRSLINFFLSFAQGYKYGSICILLNTDIQFDHNHLLKLFFPPVCISVFFIKNQVLAGVQISCLVFNFNPMTSLSILCQYHVIFYQHSSAVQCLIRYGDTFNSSFIFQDYFLFCSSGFLFIFFI